MQHAIITAKKVTGTAVTNPAGEDLGRIEDLAIEKVSGRVVYAILSFGGLLGIGAKHFALPWEALHYGPDRDSYIVEIDPEVLRRAPGFDPDTPPDMSDRRWGAQIHEYYGYQPYWDARAEAAGARSRTGTRS
jgi:sporulation protein YlmC with PRC-barrel domain